MKGQTIIYSATTVKVKTFNMFISYENTDIYQTETLISSSKLFMITAGKRPDRKQPFFFFFFPLYQYSFLMIAII